MQRVTGIMVVTLAAALLGGCAWTQTRDDYLYSRSSEGLWNADYGLLDWNFPTAQNQPPLEGPMRLHPERTAIGVTWATTDTWPYYTQPWSNSTSAGDKTAKADEGRTVSATKSANAASPVSAGASAPAAGVATSVAAGGAPPAAGGNH